jgi:hypothetical protein
MVKMAYHIKTVYIASWGRISPCHKIIADGLMERLYFWKCKVSEIGIVKTSELIRGNLYTLDELQNEKSFYVNVDMAKQAVIDHYKIVDQENGAR